MKKVFQSTISTAAIVLVFLIIYNEFHPLRTVIVSQKSPDLLASQDNISKEKTNPSTEFAKLINIVEKKKGKYSISIKNLYTQEIYPYNENQTYYAASLYKFPVAVETLKQVELKNITREEVDNLLTNLIKNSDNYSQDKLIDILGENNTAKAFNFLTQKEFGAFFNVNESNTTEIGLTFENFYTGDYLNTESKKYIIDLMSKTGFDDRISAYLDSGITFAHKIGNWPEKNSWHDCGLVFGRKDVYTVCLMTENVKYEDFLDIAKQTAGFLNSIVN